MATVKKALETKHCLICGQEKPCNGSNNKFYKHWNDYIKDDYGFCKQCVEEIGLKNDIKEVHRLLRLMDMPFIPIKWQDCTTTDNTLVSYIGSGKGLNNPRATIEGVKIADMRYEDSPTYSVVKDVDKFLLGSDAEKLENINKWGEHYSQAEYMKMNASVDNNIKITGRDDYQSIKNFERVARAEVERDRAYANSGLKPSDKKSAEDNVTNMMKQAGLSYEQTTRNSDSTLGTDIRDIIENFEPVDQPLDEYKDVDGMGTYFYKFVLKPMMRVMGKDASQTIDDYYEIKEDILRKKSQFANGGED